MLRIQTFKSAGAVVRYLREEASREANPSRGDYFAENDRAALVLCGRAAERLGLSGPISPEAFDKLARNEHPLTGERLTQRTKSNRRDGFDISFHPPKAYSIQAMLAADPAAVEATVVAVERTMAEMEQAAKCRVRVGGQNTDRTTGNMAYVMCMHETSRPVDGIVDPQSHVHVFSLNVTYDEIEKKWKALELCDIKTNAPYYEALFHLHLREAWAEAGYELTKRGDHFVPAGISEECERVFSRRTAVVEETARRRGITDPRQKAELGARTREKKNPSQSLDELRAEWRSRLSPEQREAIENARDRAERVRAKRQRESVRVPTEPPPRDRQAEPQRPVPPPSPQLPATPSAAARDAISRALEHALERDSAVSEKRLLAIAMKKAEAPLSLEELRGALSERSLIRHEREGESFLTTQEVLQEERSMIAFARHGRGVCPPLAADANPTGVGPRTDQHREAYRAILGSFDRVVLLRGAAGTRRMELMSEVIHAIERRGTKVFTFAPSGVHAREHLRNAGIENAETVAKLLTDKALQKSIQGQVLWIDQAGHLGVRGMARVFELARKRDARVILSGDDRRHGPVDRGNAFALLAREAGVKPVELKAVERQHGDLRQALAALADGRSDSAWQRLERLGAITELPQQEAHRQLAREYVAATRRRQTALVVAPGRRERERVTQTIRRELRAAGRLKGKDRQVEQLQSLGWSEAERRDAANYRRGQILRFFRPSRGFHTGDKTRVLGRDPLGNVWVKGKAGPQLLKTSHGDRFDVYEKRSITLARGDVIRITGSGKTALGGHSLRSGATYRVAGFVPLSGDLILSNGWIVKRSFGHLTHGYCVSSYTAQDKQVGRVFVAQSRDSFRSTSREQFYSALGAARQKVRVFTDDAAGLRERVATPEPRPSATALEQERLAHHFQRHLDSVRRTHVRSLESTL